MIGTSKGDFKKRNPSTLLKKILPCKSETNHILETENGRQAHPGTRKERLDDSGYDSISDEEKDARPRFPLTHAAAGAKRRCYNNLEKESRQEASQWSVVLDEADELAGLHRKTFNSFNPSVVPEERRYHKGGRGGSKVKFSFRSLSSKEDFSRDFSLSKDEACNSCEEEDIEGQAARLMEEEGGELANRPGFHKQLAGAPSVSELLEDMQKTDPSLRRTPAVDNIKVKERQASSSKKSLLYLGDRVLDNKHEFTGEISSEDEHIDQDYRAAQIVKGQTMADLFQEAFSTSTEEIAEFPRSNKFGFHRRLQPVIKLEKDRHMQYLKSLQTGRTPSNESSRVIVRISSRILEAKLTVCQCLFGESSESLECEKKTIIFSPTFCNNVELEVGSIVCIHRPWKEVQVNGGEIIILCAYFSTHF